MESLVHLTRPPSHVYKGEPFLPERVVPIDTFPHTNNFSTAILLVRVPMRDMANPQSDHSVGDVKVRTTLVNRLELKKTCTGNSFI